MRAAVSVPDARAEPMPEQTFDAPQTRPQQAREGKTTMESERTFEKEADHRMEAIRAWATVVQQSLMMQGPDFAGEVGYLSRIIELAKEADE